MKSATLLILLALSALTFGAVDEFDAYIADISILQDKGIQAELGITEPQRAAMNKHADWFNTQGTSVDSQVRAKKISTQEANRLMAGHLVTMKQRIVGELTAGQLKRLREITLQRDGLLPLLDKKVADKIGMTEAQRKKLFDTYVANDKKAKQLQQDTLKPIFDKYAKMSPKTDDEKKKLSDQMNKELAAANEKIKPQLTKLGKEFSDLVDSTLTAGQKTAFTNLKGKPFVPKKS